MTAMDAGFWTAMRIRKPWLRDICSLAFTVYYLFAAERADEKVRRVRATLTVEHLRVAWNKNQSPYLKFFQLLLNPSRNKFAPRAVRIPRPKESVYKEPVEAWLYFEGTREELKNCTKLILDVPGGGYVAMSPRHHDDKLLAWSRQCPGIPVLAIDYRKAPEFPYPYGVNEVYDVYHTLIATRGRCIGFNGDSTPRIVLVGDSAGGNFAAAVTLMILNSASTSSTGHLSTLSPLPPPDGLVLIYPSLDLSMSSWMSDEQMKLIRQRNTPSTRSIINRKSAAYTNTSLLPSTPNSDSDSSSSNISPETPHYTTRLAMSSRLSYFSDRVLTPEMMRAMVMLYVGPHNKPDFATDFLLSPIVAPESLLARFPKTYFLTGERDPLVDDTVIFAGRIRAAKRAMRRHRREMGLDAREVDEEEQVEVSLIQGISHGFLMMASLFPQAKREMRKCSGWFNAILADKEGVGKGNAGLAVPGEEMEGDGEGYTTAFTSEDDRPLEIGGGLEPPKRTRRRPKYGSAHSLGSEVDIVGRRMKGLAKGLTKEEE